jgi:hypothetical protein
MLGLAHVALHLGFCSAITRLSPQAPVALHVRLTDSGKDVELDRVFNLTRGEENQTTVEFDAHRGAYLLSVDYAGGKCTAYDYLYFLPDHNRSVSETLADGVAPPGKPMLLFGTTPMSFASAKPTFVLFPKSVACKAPVGTPLAAQIQIERDRDAYYTWLYRTPEIDALGGVTVALRIGTSTGLFHYIRVPMDFPVAWGGFPSRVQFDVTEDALDELAGEPPDVLLCPKLWKTTFG